MTYITDIIHLLILLLIYAFINYAFQKYQDIKDRYQSIEDKYFHLYEKHEILKSIRRFKKEASDQKYEKLLSKHTELRQFYVSDLNDIKNKYIAILNKESNSDDDSDDDM